MKGYWTDFYFVGIFPNGVKKYYATEEDYKEEYLELYPED